MAKIGDDDLGIELCFGTSFIMNKIQNSISLWNTHSHGEKSGNIYTERSTRFTGTEDELRREWQLISMQATVYQVTLSITLI